MSGSGGFFAQAKSATGSRIHFMHLLHGVSMCIIAKDNTHEVNMRTNIVIDDSLMMDALKFTGLNTKREAVEEGLKVLIKLKKQENIKTFRGKLHWEGDLEQMRTDK